MIIDLHSHLIPNVDEGVEHMVLTPHHRNGAYFNRREDVIKYAKDLQADYDAADVKLKVYPSQEICLTDKLLGDFYNGTYSR